jgi:T-complex protein 1 subunit theta
VLSILWLLLNGILTGTWNVGPATAKVQDIRSTADLFEAVRTTVASNGLSNEEFLGPLVFESIHSVFPAEPLNFHIDNIRAENICVIKVIGSTLSESKVIRGMVFPRQPEGSIKKAIKAKIGVYSCPIGVSTRKEDGVFPNHPKEMPELTKGEELQLETAIQELRDSGVQVVIAGSTLGELALRYFDRHGILVVQILSVSELRRACRLTGATPLTKFTAPTQDEMGTIDIVETDVIGGDLMTVFRQGLFSTTSPIPL